MKINRIIFAFALLVLCISVFLNPSIIESANISSVKDTLQSSRLSFAGRVKSPTAVGSSHVWIYTTSAVNFYSVSTAGLKIGDVLTIGSGSYTIASILDEDEFTTTAVLSAGDVDDTDPIYYKAVPQHVITFNTASAIADGFFRILIPAAATNFNDSIPDSTGFDFNSTVDIAASNSTNYTFTNNTAIVSGSTGCTAPPNYHCFEFHYSGSGAISAPIQFTIGNKNGINTLIAPAPSSTHAEAIADIYSITVQNFSAGADPTTDIPVDKATTKIGTIESVRVKAVVPPPSITATPPLGEGLIITPTTIIPTAPTPLPPITKPSPKVILDLFYIFLLVLLVFGLVLHLFMTAYGTATPLRFIPKFLFILAYPFLRRQRYQTIPFCYIDIFISDKLDHPWQSTVSDIKGFYDLKSPVPSNLFISLTAVHHKWKDSLFKGSTIPVSCLYPIPIDPSDRSRLRQTLYDARIIPLVIAVLTSITAFFIEPSYLLMSYIYLSLQYLFSEYLYPKLTQ